MPKNYQSYRLLSYKVNRPLCKDEIRDHMPRDKPSQSEPYCQMTVLKMNSTFLECVDRLYGARGAITAGGIVIGPLVFAVAVEFPFYTLSRFLNTPEKGLGLEFFLVLSDFFIALLALIGFTIFIRMDCFRHTHYPLRFNRKTRMVHVFRTNGTVLSVPWDKLYFTLGYGAVGIWEVLGHLLAEDGKTIKETFVLSTVGMREDPELRSQWEFIRRYMEEGPEKLYDQVITMYPVDKKKEPYLFGLKRFSMNFAYWPIVTLIFSPLILLGSIGRWIAMRTCKIPRWPAEVEAESEIDPNDPYICDERYLASYDDMLKVFRRGL